jgi:hypothetical protein
LAEIFARVRDRQPEDEEEGDVFEAIAKLIGDLQRRVAELEQRRAASAGRDGVSVTDIRVEADDLIISTSDGCVRNLGRVVGKDGKDGAAAAPKSLEFVRDGENRIAGVKPKY